MNLRLLFIFCLVSIMSTAQDKKTLLLWDKANKDFKEKKFELALDSYQKYLNVDSSKTDVFFKIGQIYEIFRDKKQAENFYKILIKKDTNKTAYLPAYTFLGSRALERGEFASAKNYLTVSQQFINKNSMVFQQVNRQLKTANFGILAMANAMNINPTVLPPIVNFKSKQYFPILSADNQNIVYTARGDNEDENIYQSSAVNGIWSKPVSISENINTPFNEGTCSISADGKTMVFTSCEGREGFGSCDLFISKKENNTWSKPKNMGPAINTLYWDSQPSLSSDGSRLYFSSERPFGLGKKDIWVSDIDEKGNWKKAVNAGKEINTSYDEVSPFIHANGQALFFSSNGKEGMGSYDIHMAILSPQGFQESVNVGYPINTTSDEISLFITADGKKAYYSVDDSKNVKLFSFDIPESFAKKINKTYYIKGYVLEGKTEKPLYASLELIDANTGAKLSKFMSDPITGDYMAILPGGGKYVLYVQTQQHFFKSLKFDFNGEKSNEDLDIKLEKIEKDKAETLENIYFDSGSSKLRAESEIELLKLIELLKNNATLKVEISAHTDDVGADPANLDLSKKRAESVLAFMKDKGLDVTNVKAVGYGETKPKVKNISEANRQINRRIEMKFL